jgi:hypothetical protein
MAATPRVAKSTPVLLAERIEPCLEFWARLGFEATTKAPEGDHLAFAILSNGAAEIMYETRAAASADLPALTSCAPTALFVEVQDLAAVRAAVASAPVVVAERKTPYGSTENVVRDPAGHLIIFAQFAA